MNIRKFVHSAALWVVALPIIPLYLVAKAGEAAAEWSCGLAASAFMQRHYDRVERADAWLARKLGS